MNFKSENNDVKFTIAGVLFLLVALLDYFNFYYTPSQANIFIGDSTRSRADRIKFDAYKQSIVSNGMSVFELVKQEEKKAKEISRISFRSPFAQTDFILLLTAATFKVAASRVNYDLQSILNDILVADSDQV